MKRNPPIQTRFLDGTVKEKRRTAAYEAGELHRAWPEWAWDGERFVKADPPRETSELDWQTPELYWWSPTG